MKFSPLALILFLLLAHAAHSAESTEINIERFFAVVERGNVTELTELMHPKLAAQIDAPILDAWLQAIAFRLGPVKTILPETSLLSEDRQELTAEVLFQKGIAEVELKAKDGQIVGFEVVSPRMANWFQRPTSMTLYRKRCQSMIDAWIAGDFETCRNSYFPSDPAKLSDMSLETMQQQLITKLGSKSDLSYQQAVITILPNETISSIDLHFKTADSETIVITLVFLGMQGRIRDITFSP